jgi:DNA polymerase I-like protein with 3'-5' exonuclease and polymerase domains
MLDNTITYDDGNTRNWNLSFPIDHEWSTSKRRLLVVLQTVDGRDLKEEGLLKSKQVRTALIEALKLGRKMARQRNENIGEFAFCVVNYNAFRHLHLREQAKVEAESEFKVRLQKIIKKLDPTHIFFSGDLNKLYPIKNAQLKNGWVHKIDNRLVTSTLDFARLLEKKGVYANLLGFWCRHLSNLLEGKLPFDLKDLVQKPRLVDTMSKFEKMMVAYDKAKEIGVDTETKNLSVTNNKIFTIQMTFDHSPTIGWVLPVDHPHKDNPFTIEERREIKRQLQQRFGDPESKRLLIAFNGLFDLRVIRRSLKLHVIYMPVWEIMAGEHLLDENISSLSSLIGKGAGGLAATLCAYGNDFYLQDRGFTKADRATVASVSPRDKDFLDYGAMDSVSLLGIKTLQIERSRLQHIRGKNYRPFFVNHMIHQMSDTVHQLSHLKESGSMVNLKYLKSLTNPESVLAKAIEELGDEFKTFPEVQEANKQLLSESGFKAGSLFGSKKGSGSQWTFSFTKAVHKAKLFFDIMGYEPLNKTANGSPSVDKEFIETYKDRNFLIAKYGEFQEASRMLSTNVKGYLKLLLKTADGRADDHLRSDIVFFPVDTGRLASQNPNLMNIPNRGKLSKIIKEMFITPDGHLLIRFDYSAHEVKGWSLVSGDKVLAAVFKCGQSLRQAWIKEYPSQILKDKDGKDLKLPLAPELTKKYETELKSAKDHQLKFIKQVLETSRIAARLKKEGDIHIQNCFRFFQKWVEKSDPLRDAIKAVVFGAIYMKGATTLGHDTKKAELDALKIKIGEAYKTDDKKVLAKLEDQYKHLIEEDRTDYAQSILDKMFGEFKAGKQWIDNMCRLAEEEQYVYSPIGRIRHLYATITKDKTIVNRQIRRGVNAPIQGFASEIAVKASRLLMLDYYKNQDKLKSVLNLDPKAKFPIRFNRIVHDASYFTVPFEMVIPFIHMLQHDMTYGIAKAYEEQFGFKFTVEPEIELEVGVKDTKSYKWSWAIPELLVHLSTAVSDGLEAGYLTGDKKDIVNKIFAPWRSGECRAMLNKNWPLLNVDLEKEIEAAMEVFEE